MHTTASFLVLVALSATATPRSGSEPGMARPNSWPGGATGAPAQSGDAPQRELELQAVHEVKTAPEPNRPPDPTFARPAIGEGGVCAPHDPAPLRSVPDPRAPLPPVFRVDHTRMHYDAPGDGSLWARGASYKMSFDAAGVTCFPLFGGEQPRHLPLALSPDSVTLGGEPLEIGEAPPANRWEDSVELDRGLFTERYELTPDSLEQLFVFPTLDGEGELVVRIPIAPADETIEVVATPSGLEIESELGRVSYGSAVAIDGSGRRIEAETTFADGAITIRVDAAFVASATMPLVIDPIVTPLGIDTTSYDDHTPDVAYDPSTQRWLVVYAENATAGDQDVYYTMLNSAGASMWGGYVNSNLASWSWASCANLSYHDQFLVACQVYSNGAFTVRGRTIEADVSFIGNEFFISGNESGDKLRPDVGGEESSSAKYCVAYERVYSGNDHDIFVALVSHNSSIVTGFSLSNSGGTYDTQPSIAKQTSTQGWTIAWARTPNGSSSDIWAGHAGSSGGTSISPFQVTSGNYDWYASVSSPAYNPPRTMIAFARSYGTDYDIHAVVQNGTTPIASANISTMHAGSSFLDNQSYPHVDSDGEHFLLGYSEQPSLTAHESNVFVDELYVIGSSIGLLQARVPLATTPSREVGPRIAMARSWLNPIRRYLLAWTKETSTGNNDILGALFDGSSIRSATTFCYASYESCPCNNYHSQGYGCSNSVNVLGAALWLEGIPAPAYDTAVLRAGFMPPTAACLFYQGTSVGLPTPFGDGLSCMAGSIVRLATKAAVNGQSSYPESGELPLHVRGGVPSTGGLRTYQVWYRNAAVYCTPSTFNLTNGMLVNWAN